MQLEPYIRLFSFVNETGIREPITSLISLGVEERFSEYYYDNNFRNLNAYLFQYTLRGKGILETGNVRHEVEAGQGFFIEIPSDTRYYLPKSSKDGWTFLFLMVEKGKMEEYYRGTVDKSGVIFSLEEDDPVIKYFEGVYSRARAGMISDFIESSMTAFEFMNRIYFRFHSDSSRYSSRIQHVLHLIQNHYASINGIQEIAEDLNLSENHLIREFKREVGITPMRYITQLRIEHAKKMLLTSNMQVEEISAACGYTRANYFCRVFRNTTGMSPLSYRGRVNSASVNRNEMKQGQNEIKQE